MVNGGEFTLEVAGEWVDYLTQFYRKDLEHFRTSATDSTEELLARFNNWIGLAWLDKETFATLTNAFSFKNLSFEEWQQDFINKKDELIPGSGRFLGCYRRLKNFQEKKVVAEDGLVLLELELRNVTNKLSKHFSDPLLEILAAYDSVGFKEAQNLSKIASK